MDNLKVIAHIHTDLPEKFGIPRQSGLVPELKGTIVFEKEFSLEAAVKGIEEYTGFNETYIELLKMGLSDNKIELLTKHYGNVLEVLSDNCFKPYYEINGFGYKSSVLLANQMGLEAMDTRRQDAYICNICRELSMSTGNTFLTFANIVERVDGSFTCR